MQRNFMGSIIKCLVLYEKGANLFNQFYLLFQNF